MSKCKVNSIENVSGTATFTVDEVRAMLDAGSIGVGQTWQDVTGSRVVGTTYTVTVTSPDKIIDEDQPHDFKPQQAVNLIIANSTELGYKAIINHSYWGVLYKDEVFQRLSFGQSKKGFIKHIRPDGKIDLSLQGGQETRDKNSTIILNYLKSKNGFAAVHDKSDPTLISELFGMSKGAFKKTLGSLYKQRLISIEKEGIRLI